MVDGYKIGEHIHRFAVWTAARAASKSRLSNLEIATLIYKSRLKQKVEDLSKIPSLTHEYYHEWIRETGNAMIEIVKSTVYKTGVENFKNNQFTFGIAAKVISIYIKTIAVLPASGESKLAEIAYPPIDSILLKSINENCGLKLKHQWSTFDWNNYEETILVLKEYFNGVPMWKIEVYWNLSNNKENAELS